MTDDAHKIRATACATCPYRRTVPSGIWDFEEYMKLVRYDADTGYQPPNVFMCHSTPVKACRGWAVCHSNREPHQELLALRLARIEPPFDAPDREQFFHSGTAAAIHGSRDIEEPKHEAQEAIRKVVTVRGIQNRRMRKAR